MNKIKIKKNFQVAKLVKLVVGILGPMRHGAIPPPRHSSLTYEQIPVYFK
jgi:hypothetical protein